MPTTKSCARTVLRPFALARAVASWTSQCTYELSPSSASPAKLQSASLTAARTFDAISNTSLLAPFAGLPLALAILISSDWSAAEFMALRDLRGKGLGSLFSGTSGDQL